ncbi:hypothetical protein AMJ86_00770 [bacterium SM23_57]|nr:MAG: hypothetical protein AMJ86_00770 [bacterium SM23_57]
MAKNDKAPIYLKLVFWVVIIATIPVLFLLYAGKWENDIWLAGIWAVIYVFVMGLKAFKYFDL